MHLLIVPLEPEYSSAALELICEEFSLHSPLHRALEISTDEYHEYLLPRWNDYAFGKQSSSLIALEPQTRELLGCLIAIPYTPQTGFKQNVPQRMRPIAALLEHLEYQIKPLDSDLSRASLLVDLAVVKHSRKGQGIYKQLRESVHSIARKEGYSYVLGELSSAATQHVCVKKMGHQVLAEVPYADFSFQGTLPFATIDHPVSIQLVAHSLPGKNRE